jgi:hypothetical protein
MTVRIQEFPILGGENVIYFGLSWILCAACPSVPTAMQVNFLHLNLIKTAPKSVHESTVDVVTPHVTEIIIKSLKL